MKYMYIREIPLTFESLWGNADVALRCSGSDSLLYINRMTMATFSPFFNALFFSDFSEETQLCLKKAFLFQKNKDVVDLEIDHADMLDILGTLHHLNRNFSNRGHKLHNSEKLLKLYQAADKYDIPIIRDLVCQQLREINPYDAYLVSVELNLQSEKSHSFQRMSAADVKKLLNQNDLIFSTDDVKGMMVKLQVGGITPTNPQTDQKPEPKVEELPTIPKKEESIRSWAIPKDFDVPWATSDAVLRTNDEAAPHLHINKSVLASFSPFFHAMFFAEDTKQLQDVVDIDVDFKALHEILKILHHVDRKFGLKDHQLYDTDMLSKIYTAAQKLEIDVIEQMFKQQFSLAKPSQAFEVCIQLGLHEERTEMLKKMTLSDVNDFLKKNCESHEIIFSAVDINQVLEKIREQILRSMQCKQSITYYGNNRQINCSDARLCGHNNIVFNA